VSLPCLLYEGQITPGRDALCQKGSPFVILPDVNYELSEVKEKFKRESWRQSTPAFRKNVYYW
jgi:hypothetical protein